MAIKLVNALRNFRIEDNEVEIQKIISFLINNCGYKESQIDASLIIQDDDYIEISEHLEHYEIKRALEIPVGFGSERELYEYMEMTMNQLIPNREPPHYTKYSDVAKKLISTEVSAITYNENKDNNKSVKTIEEEVSRLRARLMELFAEQKNWQKQLQEVGENMTFDDVRNQIKLANEKIAKHQDVIVKCEGHKNGRWTVPLWDADSEYTTIKVDYDGNEPIDSYGAYSIEHSRMRIAFWKCEIAKHEQKLQMMEIAQQQLTQVMQDIADVNEQIKNATTSQTSEPLVKEPSTKVEKISNHKINTGTTRLYRIDNLPLEICQDKFNDIIITSPNKGKQKVLRCIRNNMTHFNPDCFSHEELASELNNLQSRFIFTKTDVDKAYQDKNDKK